MSSLLRTADLPARERADFWRSSISEAFVPLDMTLAQDDTFRGQIRTRNLGVMLVSDVAADAHKAERTRRLIARSETDYYKLSMPLQGYCLVMQDGREAPLTPGDLAVYDTGRPYTVAFDNTCRMLVLMFPQRFLRLRREEMHQVTANRVSGRQGLGALVSPLLMNLVTKMDEIGENQSLQLADNILDLLTTLFSERLGKHGAPPPSSPQTLLLRIRTFIEAHLDDGNLTPDTVAAAVHISTGYLHKLFRMEGTTVSRFIRERRLEHCRRDLVDPEQWSLSVSTVAAHWGFVDAAHFSRLFKATYGVSPREYRLTRDAHGGVAVSALVESAPQAGQRDAAT
ncbi:helix-turn-helix domain-containing protein [Streptosporangium carneum]|uniref:AraC family transcriptional regulator n=1 Tax=Streptosporangium carneum TaxID=47481 RepID=A0A9W6MHW2_9ACTN|nr:helix-turn-helix domain-containing protein [Streptosporangium carneum]GLK14620.1 AraC family transcriptional regulator [Streptosporangium carneum]